MPLFFWLFFHIFYNIHAFIQPYSFIIFLCLQWTECEERGAAVPHVRRASPRAPHLTLRGSALPTPSPPLSSHQAIQVTTHIQNTYFIRLRSKVFFKTSIDNNQGFWQRYEQKITPARVKNMNFLKKDASGHGSVSAPHSTEKKRKVWVRSSAFVFVQKNLSGGWADYRKLTRKLHH
jgi:hypothetical protein